MNLWIGLHSAVHVARLHIGNWSSHANVLNHNTCICTRRTQQWSSRTRTPIVIRLYKHRSTCFWHGNSEAHICINIAVNRSVPCVQSSWLLDFNVLSTATTTKKKTTTNTIKSSYTSTLQWNSSYTPQYSALTEAATHLSIQHCQKQLHRYAVRSDT